MVTSGTLASVMAEATEIPEATIALFIRILREDGLIRSGARGVNATKLSYVEVARLLISLMVTDKPARAATAARDFGALVLSPDSSNFEIGGKAKFAKLCGLASSPNLETAVAAMIQIFAEEIESKTFKAAKYRDYLPVTEIRLAVDKLAAILKCPGASMVFNDAMLLAMLGQQLPDVNDLEALIQHGERDAALSGAHFEKSTRYKTKIGTERYVGSGVLEAIAIAMVASK
jgi:hypothetical protein